MAISTFILLAGLGLVIIVLNGVGGNPVVLPNPFNCSAVQTAINQEVSDGLNVASTVCAIAGDLLALLVTWRKTYTTYKAERGLLRGPSLIRVMLYNGSIYFLDITTINILNLVLYQTSSGVANYASIVTTPLSIVLTCHFLLNLRRTDRTANAPPSLMSIPSLNLNAVRDIQSGRPRSLPAFVASMGSEVHTGLDFVDSIARDQDWANEERSRVAEDLPHAYGDGGR